MCHPFRRDSRPRDRTTAKKRSLNAHTNQSTVRLLLLTVAKIRGHWLRLLHCLYGAQVFPVDLAPCYIHSTPWNCTTSAALTAALWPQTIMDHTVANSADQSREASRVSDFRRLAPSGGPSPYITLLRLDM